MADCVFRILDLVAAFGLVFFTVVLAFATYRLYRSTDLYRKATERLARVEELSFLDEAYKRVYHAPDSGASDRIRDKDIKVVDALAGVPFGESADGIERDRLKENLHQAYGILSQELFDEMKQDRDSVKASQVAGGNASNRGSG